MIIELLQSIKQEVMKGKILGISLSILGVGALIVTLIGINGVVTSSQVNILLAGGVAGTILFFTGIWLLPGRTLSGTAGAKSPKASPSVL
jgi:hypothetical protein